MQLAGVVKYTYPHILYDFLRGLVVACASLQVKGFQALPGPHATSVRTILAMVFRSLRTYKVRMVIMVSVITHNLCTCPPLLPLWGEGDTALVG